MQLLGPKNQKSSYLLAKAKAVLVKISLSKKSMKLIMILVKSTNVL